MSYIQDIEFEFEIGDSFDVTPIEGSYIIGKILALGGECYVEGNTVIISALPGKETPAPVEKTVEPTPEPEQEPTPEPAPEPGPETVQEPQKASDEVVETPVKRARKTAPVKTEVVEEDTKEG